jgi:hypothetical protein
MGVPSARYSLVKGERIVRSVLSSRFSGFIVFDIGTCTDGSVMPLPMLVGYEAEGDNVWLAQEL